MNATEQTHPIREERAAYLAGKNNTVDSKVRLPDSSTNEAIRVGTDERGWPIPAGW